MNNNIQRIISEYSKSIIQSEAEVRSKLIVPLLEILGYPSYLRAEEFPVYGFGGGKKLPAKNADYILFSDRQFANHRMFTKKNIEWVQKHSLLVVEAKKPGEMPEILGQPEYYAMWTKAIGYLVIDGVRIKGYFYNNINVDYEIVDCTINELPCYNGIWKFSFANIQNIKNNGVDMSEHIRIFMGENSKEKFVNSKSAKYLSEEDFRDIPEGYFQMLKNILGKNAKGLNKPQLISRFLGMTDALLQNDLRYDIPGYIFDFPRKTYNGYLCIDKEIFPIEQGKITEFYWEDYDRFAFESKSIQIDIAYKNDKLLNFEIGFHVLNDTVSDRLLSFERVKKVLEADNIKMIIPDTKHRVFILPSGNPVKMWTGKRDTMLRYELWKSEMEKMKIIEDFYEIKFVLGSLTGGEKVAELYNAVDDVYDGIVLNKNCDILLSGGSISEDFDIPEPMIYEKDKRLPLEVRYIHNIAFEPYESWALPGKVRMKGTKKGDIVKIDGCCRYKIFDEHCN